MDTPYSHTSALSATLSVAPMMDWTDRHCRVLHRILSRHAVLYTEMVTTGALIHGDQARYLDFSAQEQPLVLQLGGSDPTDLAVCAKLAQKWGYAGINLNCGCPSPRVQRGSFGACLMAEPALVSECVKAMRDACSLPVSVKHRIGIDQQDSYGFVLDFVGEVAASGCAHFIVHARSAWLKGLSPKENREVPPLRYAYVSQLKNDFPSLRFDVNGGIHTLPSLRGHLAEHDGVMVGRWAYQEPWSLSHWDTLMGHSYPQMPDRSWVEAQFVAYMAEQTAQGVGWYGMARHMLGLYHGEVGGRLWRQVWSDHRLKNLPPQEVSQLANERRLHPQYEE